MRSRREPARSLCQAGTRRTRRIDSPRKKLLFAALYLAEGAPIGLLWWYLPTELRARGVDVADITAVTATLALPWALKFLWAPLLDVVRGERIGLRGWIAGAQLGMAATLAPLLWLDLAADFDAIAVLLFAHAFFAATQDVAIDAWAIGSSDPDERGALNAWMQAGMLSGRVLFSGGALWLGASLGTPFVVGALLCVLVLTLTLLVFPGTAPLPPRDGSARQRAAAVGRALVASVRSRAVRQAIVVAIVGGAGFEAVGALAGPFLVDLGRARETVGTFWILAALAAIPGGLFGGWLADRHGHARATSGALLALTAAIAVLAAAAATGRAVPGAEAMLVLVFLCLGAFNATSYALFMDLSATAARATTFSAFMGLTNLCEAWAARLAGELVTASGYGTAFAAPAALSLLALPFLARLRRRARGAG